MAQLRVVIQVLDDARAQSVGRELQAILERESRYEVSFTTGPLLARTWGADSRPDLIIPLLPPLGNGGARLLAALGDTLSGTPVLPVMRSEDLSHALDEPARWTNDFLLTPLRPSEVLGRVRRLLLLSQKHVPAAARERGLEDGLAQLVGEDRGLVVLKQKLPLMARYGASVLLTGETGTGKELCARALHYLSPRAGRPFLPVNCGAIPVDLFESELFGHQKGAFTGAWVAHAGLVEEAEGGTLFLDEIQNLSLPAQVKLLRFIEDHTYHPLGCSKARQADVWVIAATNLELKERIRQGTFREDLYYRLAVMSLDLPPLRARRGDIPMLIGHFWAKYERRQGDESRRLSPRAMQALCDYSWPGNIRELENVIQQLIVLTDAAIIDTEDLPIAIPVAAKAAPGLAFNKAKAQVIEQFERVYVAELLRANLGNVTRAAQEAQKERRSFGRLVKKHQLGSSR